MTNISSTLPASGLSLSAVQPAIEKPAMTADQKVAREKAEEFESSFLTTMLESMFAGVETEAPFGGGHAEKTYRSVLLAEYATDMSKSGGIGIADAVYREILALQEGGKQK